MGELPFLVVHGALVAKLLVATMSGLLLMIVRSGQRVRLRRRLRRDTVRRAGTAVSPSEGIVTLRGVWRESAGQRWLDCNGERVELDAEVRVHQGTRARWCWRAPAALPVVGHGDEVLATGKLRRRLGTADAVAGYRELAGAWVLGALPVHRPVELWAVEPVVCSPPLSLRTTLAVIACGFASFCVLHATGAYVRAGVAIPDYYTAQRTRTAIDPFEPIVIATALPGSRRDALDVLAHIVNREMIRSPAARDLSIALTGLRLGCETQAFEMIEQARFRRRARARSRLWCHQASAPGAAGARTVRRGRRARQRLGPTALCVAGRRHVRPRAQPREHRGREVGGGRRQRRRDQLLDLALGASGMDPITA